MDNHFSLSARAKSVKFAINGIKIMLRTQHNAWIHAAVSIIVLITGGLLCLTASQWCYIVLAIVVVWTAEALNTALELLADVTSLEFHPLVEKAKDVAAGAVLISAIGSVIIGLLVFGPCFLELLKSML